MADEVTARLAIAVQAGEALKQIGDVQDGVRGVTAARADDLRMINRTTAALRAKARAEKSGAAATKRSSWGMASDTGGWRTVAEKERNAELERGSRLLAKQAAHEKRIAGILEQNLSMTNREREIKERTLEVQIAERRATELTAAAEAKSLAFAKARAALDEAKRGGNQAAIVEATKAYNKALGKSQVAELAAMKATDAVTTAKNALAAAQNGTTVGMKKYSAAAIAARAASRGLGVSIGNSLNPAMLKAGIIIAGVVSVVKLATLAYDLWRQGMREEAELARRNSEELKERAERHRKLADRQREAMSVIDQLRQKEGRLSEVDKFDMGEAIRKIGTDYRELGADIDETTGKIRNFEFVSMRLRRLQINRETADINKQIENLIKEQNAQAQIRDTGIGVGGVKVGGEEERKRAGEEALRIGKEIVELRERLNELSKENPEARYQAQLKDRAFAIRDLLAAEEEPHEIRALRAEGNEMGAAWAERELQLRREIYNITEQELKIYKRRWTERENEIKDLKRAQEEQKRAQETAKADTERFGRERFKFRETSQSEVSAAGLEAVRLQSRMMIQNGGLGENPQKVTAEQSRKQTAYLLDIRDCVYEFVNGSSTTTFTFRTV